MKFSSKTDLDIFGGIYRKKEDINANIPQYVTEKPLNPDSTVTNKTFSPLLRQIVASSGPILATISAGMTSGFSAVLLPQLQRNDSLIPINHEEASWIASMAALPMAAGCILGGIIMEQFGRKMAHLFLNIPFLLGWILISFSPNITWLLIGRFLTGICVGLLGPPASVYIGETTDPKYRGFFLAAVSLAIAIGILISHILGTFFSWTMTALLCGICPFLSFLLMLCAPESPSWLISKGNIESAANSFQWLRGYTSEAKKEFDSIVSSQNTSSQSSNYSWVKIKQNIRKPSFLKPLLILLGFFFTMQFAGVNAVAFYSVTIMKQTIGTSVNEYLAMIVIDVVRFAMSIVACVLLRNVGRRPLAAVSGAGTAGSLLGLSIFLYYSTKDPSILQFAWIPMTLLVSFICFVSIGIVPLPWCMTGELFPLALRGLGSAIVSCMNFLCFFAVVKTSPLLFLNIGPEGAFMIYGSVALVGTIFLFICLPETRNRTLQEIENSFTQTKSTEKNNVIV